MQEEEEHDEDEDEEQGVVDDGDDEHCISKGHVSGTNKRVYSTSESNGRECKEKLCFYWHKTSESAYKSLVMICSNP